MFKCHPNINVPYFFQFDFSSGSPLNVTGKTRFSFSLWHWSRLLALYRNPNNLCSVGSSIRLGGNLICVPVSHVYFFVGGGRKWIGVYGRILPSVGPIRN